MHGLCKKKGIGCQLPTTDSLVAISEGVFEGDPVQGVRHRMDMHMSGWIITSDLYDGNVSSLRTEHLVHLIESRPDLEKYLCLPIGWRFDSARDDVWFDQQVALK
jgi:hypothetical protein